MAARARCCVLCTSAKFSSRRSLAPRRARAPTKERGTDEDHRATAHRLRRRDHWPRHEHVARRPVWARRLSERHALAPERHADQPVHADPRGRERRAPHLRLGRGRRAHLWNGERGHRARPCRRGRTQGTDPVRVQWDQVRRAAAERRVRAAQRGHAHRRLPRPGPARVSAVSPSALALPEVGGRRRPLGVFRRRRVASRVGRRRDDGPRPVPAHKERDRAGRRRGGMARADADAHGAGTRGVAVRPLPVHRPAEQPHAAHGLRQAHWPSDQPGARLVPALGAWS